LVTVDEELERADDDGGDRMLPISSSETMNRPSRIGSREKMAGNAAPSGVQNCCRNSG